MPTNSDINANHILLKFDGGDGGGGSGGGGKKEDRKTILDPKILE